MTSSAHPRGKVFVLRNVLRNDPYHLNLTYLPKPPLAQRPHLPRIVFVGFNFLVKFGRINLKNLDRKSPTPDKNISTTAPKSFKYLRCLILNFNLNQIPTGWCKYIFQNLITRLVYFLLFCNTQLIRVTLILQWVEMDITNSCKDPSKPFEFSPQVFYMKMFLQMQCK